MASVMSYVARAREGTLQVSSWTTVAVSPVAAAIEPLASVGGPASTPASAASKHWTVARNQWQPPAAHPHMNTCVQPLLSRYRHRRFPSDAQVSVGVGKVVGQ